MASDPLLAVVGPPCRGPLPGIDDAVGSVQSDMYASHSHNFTTNDAPVLNFSLGSQPPRTNNTGGITATTHAAGGNETRPKNANVNFIIKT